MTYPTEDDIEIVVAGLDRIEIKVTSDVKQGEALKKRILEALKEYNWNKQMNNVSIANHYFVTLKDKAEKLDIIKNLTGLGIKNYENDIDQLVQRWVYCDELEEKYKELEAQVKSLQEDYDDSIIEIQKWKQRALKNKEKLDNVREFHHKYELVFIGFQLKDNPELGELIKTEYKEKFDELKEILGDE